MQQPGKLSLRHSQLVCQNDTGEQTIPLEDVAMVILETQQATLTTALLGALAQTEAMVITCNAKHLPNGLLLPLHAHHRALQQVQLQLGWTQPFKKRCWQTIVAQKITNQAQHLHQLGEWEAADYLTAHAKTITSGDTTNREAVAAKRYWETLGFKRRGNSLQTAVLNYGYAILRATLARQLVVCGLQPILGLHHQGQLNPWNLADDLMEPFRPWADAYMLGLNLQGPELNPQHRQQLVALCLQNVMVNNEAYNLLTACQQVTESLIKASRNNQPKDLCLPTLQITP
jgi:CRISP-associated protein Cas1